VDPCICLESNPCGTPAGRRMQKWQKERRGTFTSVSLARSNTSSSGSMGGILPSLHQGMGKKSIELYHVVCNEALIIRSTTYSLWPGGRNKSPSRKEVMPL